MIYLDFNDGLHILYREVDELSLLNKLFVTLISEKLNINNYITNTTIQNKLYLKDTLNNIDYIIDDSISNIKNLIKIKKGYPIYKIDDIELISIIKTKVAGEYKENNVIENVNGEINLIINLIRDIIIKIESNKNYEIISVLSNISYQFKTALLDLV